MLTDAQIAAGTARLEAGKLTDTDRGQLVSALRLVLRDLETVYSYDLDGKLTSLDDLVNAGQKAAQAAAWLVLMQGDGLSVGHLAGKVVFSEETQFRARVLAVLALIYPLPPELKADGTIRYGSAAGPKSQSIRSRREMRWG